MSLLVTVHLDTMDFSVKQKLMNAHHTLVSMEQYAL